MKNTMIELERIAETGRRLKLERVREWGDDPDEHRCNLPACAMAVRGGEQIVQVWQGDGPESPRVIVYYACLAFEADEVFMVSDMFVRRFPPGSRPENVPVPEVGDYQRDWEAGRRDHLSEALAVYHFTPDGHSTLHAYPYTRTGRNLMWDLKGGRSIGTTGMLGEYSREGWKNGAGMRATIGPMLEAVIEGLDEAEAQMHIDRAAARFVSAQDEVGCVVVFAGDGPPSMFDDGQESEVERA